MVDDRLHLQTILQRLDKLERRNRRQRWIGGSILICLAAMLAMGQAVPVVQQASPKQIEAERFILRSSDGQVRGVWGVDADAATLSLSAKDDRPRLTWSVRPDGVQMSLVDKTAKERAALKLLANGTVGLTLHDREGVPRVGLKIGADDTPSLGLSDRSGKVRGMWRSWPDGATGFSIHDAEGTERGTWRVSADGNTSLGIRDETGSLRAALGTTWSDLRKTDAAPDRPESSLVLYAPNGTVEFLAP